MLTRK